MTHLFILPVNPNLHLHSFGRRHQPCCVSHPDEHLAENMSMD